MAQTIADSMSEAIRTWADPDLDDSALAYTKLLLLSCLGAMIGGSRLEAGQIIARHAKRQGGKPDATVAGRGERTTVETAALVNGTFAHATEYEDDSFPEGVSTYTIIPPLLAVAEQRRTSGRRLLEAIVLGHEIQGRLGMVSLAGFERGFQLLPLMGTIGTAGGAAYLLQLERRDFTNALCISTAQAAGLRIQSRSMTHFLESGNAARAGILSAALAAEGFDAEPRSFEGRDVWRAGFLSLAGVPEGQESGFLSTFLREPYRVLEVSIKERPMCMFLQPLVPVMDLIRESEPFDVSDVDTATVYASTAFIGGCDVPRPVSHSQAAFSIQHVVALTLLQGRDITLASFAKSAIDDPAISALRDKVRIERKDDWTNAYMQSPTGISVRLKSGRVITAEVNDVHGMPPRYMSRDEVVQKFYRAAGDVLSPERLADIVSTVDGLEKLDDASVLAHLIGTP